MPKYWLMKSEPTVYSIDDLKREKSTCWEGVRNYRARNFMREMQKGDLVLFYHSNANPPGAIGVAKVVKEAYPDHHAWDKRNAYYDPKSTKEAPRWYMVDVGFVERFAGLVPLDRLKETRGLEDMMVTKLTRLSVQPVTKREFEIVTRLGRKGKR